MAEHDALAAARRSLRLKAGTTPEARRAALRRRRRAIERADRRAAARRRRRRARVRRVRLVGAAGRSPCSPSPSLGYWQTGSPLARPRRPGGSVASAEAQRPRPAPAAQSATAADRGDGRPARRAAEAAARRRAGLDHAGALVHRPRPLRRGAAGVPRAPTELAPNNADAPRRLRRRRRRDQGQRNNAAVDRADRARAERSTRSTSKALALAGTVAYDRGDLRRRDRATGRRSPTSCRPTASSRSRCRRASPSARAAQHGARNRTRRRRLTAADARTAAARRAAGSTPRAARRHQRQRHGHARPALARAGCAGRHGVRVRAARVRRPHAARRAPRARSPDLPLTFTLDDSMAMAPGMTLSSATQLTVERAHQQERQRDRRSPATSPARSAGVAPGASGIAIRDRQRRRQAVGAVARRAARATEATTRQPKLASPVGDQDAAPSVETLERDRTSIVEVAVALDRMEALGVDGEHRRAGATTRSTRRRHRTGAAR